MEAGGLPPTIRRLTSAVPMASQKPPARPDRAPARVQKRTGLLGCLIIFSTVSSFTGEKVSIVLKPASQTYLTASSNLPEFENTASTEGFPASMVSLMRVSQWPLGRISSSATLSFRSLSGTVGSNLLKPKNQKKKKANEP